MVRTIITLVFQLADVWASSPQSQTITFSEKLPKKNNTRWAAFRTQEINVWTGLGCLEGFQCFPFNLPFLSLLDFRVDKVKKCWHTHTHTHTHTQMHVHGPEADLSGSSVLSRFTGTKETLGDKHHLRRRGGPSLQRWGVHVCAFEERA